MFSLHHCNGHRLLLLLIFCLLCTCLTACQRPFELRPINIETVVSSTVTTAPSESSATETTWATGATREKPEAAVPDFSGEPQINLAAYAGGSPQSYGFAENGPGTAGLDALIRDWLVSRNLQNAAISIVYDDYGAMQRFTYQPDARYVAASTVKVPMAMVCAQLTAEDVFPAGMTITEVPGKSFAPDDPHPANYGQLVPLADLLSSALLYSDNTATSVIFEYFERHGSYLHNYIDQRTGVHFAADMTLSAREGADLMAQLYFDNRYPLYSSIIDTMKNASWSSFLSGGIPVAVSHKYGNLGGLNHEIGIAWTAHPFGYAVFTSNVDAYHLLPELGTLLYNYNTGNASIPANAPALPPTPQDTGVYGPGELASGKDVLTTQPVVTTNGTFPDGTPLPTRSTP